MESEEIRSSTLRRLFWSFVPENLTLPPKLLVIAQSDQPPPTTHVTTFLFFSQLPFLLKEAGEYLSTLISQNMSDDLHLMV